MAGPITWRTVMGASLADASRPLEAAQRSINSGISGLASLVSDQQQVAQNAVDRTNEANVQAFLDRIQGAQSVDEVNALKQSGELDALRAALTPKDLVRVRGAEDIRTKSLMDQLTSKRNFESAEAAAKAAPIRDQAMSLFLSNDPVKMAQAKQIIEANPQIQWADTLKTMNELQAQAQERQHRAQLQPLQLEAQRLTIDTTKENLTNSREDRAARKAAEATAAAQAVIDRNLETLRKTGNPYALAGVWTEDRAPELMEFLTKNNVGTPEKRQAMVNRLIKMGNQLEVESQVEIKDAKGKGTGKYQTVKEAMPIPFGTVMQAALASEDELLPFFTGSLTLGDNNTFWGWNEGRANNLEKNLKALAKQQVQGVREDGKPLPKLAWDYQKYFEQVQEKSRLAPAVGKAK